MLRLCELNPRIFSPLEGLIRFQVDSFNEFKISKIAKKNEYIENFFWNFSEKTIFFGIIILELALVSKFVQSAPDC